MKRIRKLLCDPGRYVPIGVKMLEQPLSYVFARTAFYLQGQMDIHPKSRWYNGDFVAKTGGFFLRGDSTPRTIMNLQPWDCARRDMIVLLLRSLVARRVEGQMAELGVYQGRTARLMHHYMPERELHLFDTFAGFDRRDVEKDKALDGSNASVDDFVDTDIEKVLSHIGAANENVHVHAGYFPASIPPRLHSVKFAFVHLDADLYEPTLEGLRFFFERVVPGGYILIHDYNAWIGARKAVDEFFADKVEVPVPMPDKSGSALVAKLPFPREA